MLARTRRSLRDTGGEKSMNDRVARGIDSRTLCPGPERARNRVFTIWITFFCRGLIL